MKIFTFIACIILAVACPAQPKYGMRLGAIWTYGNQNASGELVTYGSSITSYSVGLFTDVELGYRTSLNIGASYEERQVAYDVNVPGVVFGIFGPMPSFSQVNAKDRFQYLAVPVFLEYSPVDRLGFSSGPQLGVLLDVNSETIGRSFNTREFASDIDVSWGVGVEFQGERSTLGVRYNYGLADLNSPGVEGSKYHTNTLHVFLAATFN
ncbi:MAG: outer membrane beta-barrel protein [Bacteroidota bacterium]